MALVLFDCDGVLVNTEELVGRVACEVLRSIGLDYDRDVYEERLAGASEDEFCKRVNADYLAISGMPVPAQAFEDMIARYMEEEAAHIRAINGVEDFIESLVRSNVPFALCSNGSRKNIERKLSLTGLGDLFAGRIFSREDVSQGKPAPDIYLHGMAIMGEKDPGKCIVIEDSPVGVMSGHAASMHTLAFSDDACRGPKYMQRLKEAGARFVGRTMAQVAFEAYELIDMIEQGSRWRNAPVRASRGFTPS